MMEPCEICGNREMHASLRTLGKCCFASLCTPCTITVANWLEQQPTWQKSLELDQQWEILLNRPDLLTDWAVLAQDRLDCRRALFGVIRLQVGKMAGEHAKKETKHGRRLDKG